MCSTVPSSFDTGPEILQRQVSLDDPWMLEGSGKQMEDALGTDSKLKSFSTSTNISELKREGIKLYGEP